MVYDTIYNIINKVATEDWANAVFNLLLVLIALFSAVLTVPFVVLYMLSLGHIGFVKTLYKFIENIDDHWKD